MEELANSGHLTRNSRSVCLSPGADKRTKEDKAACTAVSELEAPGNKVPHDTGRELKEERGGQAESMANGEWVQRGCKERPRRSKLK